MRRPGKVSLVGAGPGDPELLTLRGKRALESATVVFYDHLAPLELLEIAPPSARRVYVGKKRTAHAYSQEQITAMLVAAGQNGERVVRLKGGDPYLFGRGGEEAEALAQAGVAFEVIPGVSSPAGIGAYAGIPLTHREHTSVVSIVTGHDPEAIEWERFGRAETLVILMGVSCLETIASRIIAAGRDPATPAAAVRWATRPDQETVSGTLGSLSDLVRERGLKPPATVVVGEVVRLRPQLSWFERLPLFGKRVVVTRPRGQSAGLATMLRDLGAEPVELPAIEIGPAADFGALDGAIGRLGDYDWVIFTSVNGVRVFFERLDRSARDLRSLRGKVAAIGPATKAALESAHLKVDAMGDEFVAEGLADALKEFDLRGKRVLMARAAVARNYLPAFLSERGAEVDVVEAYRTGAAPGLAEGAAAAFARPVDWVTFTSSSTVDCFLDTVSQAQLGGTKIASIGPVTSETIRRRGREPDAEASEYTAAGLVEAICAFEARKRRNS